MIILKCIAIGILVLWAIETIVMVIMLFKAARAERSGELPVFCLLLEEKCPVPDKSCDECELTRRLEEKEDEHGRNHREDD